MKDEIGEKARREYEELTCSAGGVAPAVGEVLDDRDRLLRQDPWKLVEQLRADLEEERQRVAELEAENADLESQIDYEKGT